MNIIIAIIILLGYTIALCIKGGGVPSSLSASVFDLRLNGLMPLVMQYKYR